MSKLSCLLLLGSMLCASTLATKCYVCQSHIEPACLDDYAGDKSHEIDCIASGKTSKAGCSKSSASGKIIGLQYYSVNRTCGSIYDNQICPWNRGLPFEAREFSITESTAWQCSCTGELCNSAPATSTWTSMSLFIFTLVIKMLQM